MSASEVTSLSAFSTRLWRQLSSSSLSLSFSCRFLLPATLISSIPSCVESAAVENASLSLPPRSSVSDIDRNRFKPSKVIESKNTQQTTCWSQENRKDFAKGSVVQLTDRRCAKCLCVLRMHVCGRREHSMFCHWTVDSTSRICQTATQLHSFRTCTLGRNCCFCEQNVPLRFLQST